MHIFSKLILTFLEKSFKIELEMIIVRILNTDKSWRQQKLAAELNEESEAD